MSRELENNPMVLEIFFNRIKDFMNSTIKKGIDIDSMTDTQVMFWIAADLSDFMKDINFPSKR